MKILYPISETTPSYGGIGSFTYKTINELIKKYPEFEAVIVTSNQQASDTFQQYFQGIDRVKIISLFEHEYKQIYRRDLQFQLRLASHINKIIATEKIDIIHHQTGHSDMFFSLPLISNLPVIMTSHGDISALLNVWKNATLQNVNEKMNYRLGKLLFYEEKYMYNRSNIITAVAGHVRLNIIKNYHINPDKVITINNFVDPERFYFHPGKLIKPYKIGFIGRPYYLKGFYDLIETINKNNQKDMFEWHLATDAEAAKKLITTDANIQYYNTIPHSELSKFYDNLDFVFIPSYSEACPTVLLESLLKGKICIIRNIVGPQEIAANCHTLVFTEISKLNLPGITEKYFENKTTLFEQLKDNRETIKNRYSMEKTINDLFQLYQKYT